MKTISIYSPKGGVGKSTIAVNLAGYYTEREGMRVAVVDLDEQQSAADIYAHTLCKFDVLVRPPTGDDGKRYDLVIFDHHPNHENIEFLGDLVVCPIRPSRLDFTSYKRGRAYMDGKPHILCVNQWTSHGQDDLDFIINMKKLAAPHGIHVATLKARKVYKNMTNKALTVFQAGRADAAIKARNEIAVLGQKILESIK